MSELIAQQQQLLHPDRRLVTPIDTFRGSDFTVALIISGAVASNHLDVLSGGGRIYAIPSSSPVRVRLLSVEMWNANAGWIEVEFRDGGTNGGRVLGPYLLPSRSEKPISREDLEGRFFTSSVFLQVLSGFAAQPLSNDGIKVNISRVNEPTDFYE